MASIRGNLMIWFIRHFVNVNPKTCQKQVEQIKKLDKIGKFKLPKGYVHEKYTIGNNLPVETIYKEGTTPKNIIYVMHGGAYVGKLNSLYRNLGKLLSTAGHDAKVVYVDYRVAPEYKYPCALEDALSCWDWILNNGYKEENIVVLGDSAGGNLTLALTLKLRETNRKLPKGVVLISPWADMTATGNTYLKNYNLDPMFGGKDHVEAEMVADLIKSPIFTWCGNNDRYNPFISPVFADYKDFPPTIITVGSHELLLSDSQTIAEKINAAGGKAILHVSPKMFHVFPLFHFILPEAKIAIKHITSFVGEQLTK